jgi:hypothetical protein
MSEENASPRKTPPKQGRTYVMNATKLEKDVHDIKVALLGDFDKPGLITRFGKLEEAVKEDTDSIAERASRIERRLTEFETKEEFKTVIPVIQTVNNWKYLVGIISATVTATGTLIYLIITAILEKTIIQ